VKLGTANIQNFPDHSPSAVRADVATVAAHVTLAGLQEIQPGEDTPLVRKELGPDWWVSGGKCETPIIGRSDRWELIDHHQIPFDRPAGLPRPQNAHGAVTSVIVRSATKARLPAFAVVNVHLISGGHNGPRLPVLAARWAVEWGMYKDECLRLYRLGLSVYAVGDLNDHDPPRFGWRLPFRWLSPTGGPDHIGELVHERSVELASSKHDAIQLHSDHDLHLISGPLRHAD
jgi:hypothetical protein